MLRVPMPPTLRHYQASWLAADVIAGLTLVAIAVPEQIATARLASMPPITGLYAFVVASVAFALLGRSPHISAGADSTIAPVMAAGVAGVAAVGSARYLHDVSALALLVGILVIAVGLLRLGWIAELLSTPVITGVLAGIAVEIAVHQLPAVLGVGGGGTDTLGRIRAVGRELAAINPWAVAIAVGVLLLIVVAEKIDRRVPAALVGVVIATAAVAVGGLKAHHVQVLGRVRGGLPQVGIPALSWAEVQALTPVALTVAFLCVAQTAATARASAAGAPAVAEFDADLVGVGAGSVLAAAVGAFAVNSSPPRSAVVVAAGGRTQVAGLTAATAVLGLVLFATALLQDLPQAALGAILLFVASRLVRLRVLAAIWRFSRIEFALAVVTAFAVAGLGIEKGILLAVLLALADRTHRSARPRDVVLGRIPGTDHWIPTDIGRPTEQVPGVVAYMVYAPLWYGNADYVRARVDRLLAGTAGPLKGFVLDANAIADVDYTGVAVLEGLAAELERRGASIGIARASHLFHHDLKHAGLLERLGPERLFVSVEDAVAAVV